MKLPVNLSLTFYLFKHKRKIQNTCESRNKDNNMELIQNLKANMGTKTYVV